MVAYYSLLKETSRVGKKRGHSLYKMSGVWEAGLSAIQSSSEQTSWDLPKEGNFLICGSLFLAHLLIFSILESSIDQNWEYWLNMEVC